MMHLLVAVLGHVALMLWGLHMLQKAIERSWGLEIRRAITAVGSGKLRSLAVGAGATALLQSSTAAILILASWTTQRFIPLGIAIAATLGANVGTTLVAQSLSWLSVEVAPALALAGIVVFRCSESSRPRDVGRILIGLGIVLFALHELSGAFQPLSQATGFTLALRILTHDPIAAATLAAIVAWLSHSSIAAILLIASMSAGGLLSAPVVIAMVLGANIGTALNPLIHSRAGGIDALRLAVANVATRMLGCAAVLPLINVLGDLIAASGEDTQRLAFHFHTLFNVGTALLFLPASNVMARLLIRLLPDRSDASNPLQPQFLDSAAVGKPAVALANAQRETLRMADVVRAMLERSRGIFESTDLARIEDIRRMDDTLDALHEEIQRYVGAVGSRVLPGPQMQKAESILSFAIHLEHIGDIVSRLMMKSATKRIKRQLTFSSEGLATIDELQSLLQHHLQLCVAAFLHSDTAAARHLGDQRERFRRIEREIAHQHFEQVCSGNTAGVPAASLLLDTIRDLRWANSRLAAAVELAVIERVYVPVRQNPASN